MLGILADGAARRLYQWAHNNAAATFPPEMQRRFTIHRPSKFLWRFELRRCRECLGPAKQDGSGVVLDMVCGFDGIQDRLKLRSGCPLG